MHVANTYKKYFVDGHRSEGVMCLGSSGLPPPIIRLKSFLVMPSYGIEAIKMLGESQNILQLFLNLTFEGLWILNAFDTYAS
jgi:hypothetical protein